MAWVYGGIVAILLLPVGAAPQTSSVSLGDIAYRKANFEQAESLYKQALKVDPKCARALLGLGKIEGLHFRRDAARDYFEAAYRLDPTDPQIIRSYAGVLTDRHAQTRLLENYLAHGGEDRSAAGQIQMNRRLGDRETGALDSPYRAYSLPMKPYCPTARPAGMLLTVTINDSKPLRLIFDTGAEGVVIRPRAAEKLGLEFLGEKQFQGAGEGEPVNGMTGLARTVSIGDLRLKNCLIDVSESLPAGDVDGVIGPALLQQFLIRFSAAEKRLELLPFNTPAGAKAIQVGHLLLVKSRIDGDRFGYFLLDTGASFSLVSDDLAIAGQGSPAASVYGMNGRAEGARVSPVRFQFAREPLVDSNVIAYDLRAMSRQIGLDISGLIGYPALSQKVLTINYRDGLIDTGR